MIKRKGYLCGPTLYSTPHIGNLKTFYCSIQHFYNSRKRKDILLMNYTDVGDKIYDIVGIGNKLLPYINYYARKTTDLLKHLGLKPWVIDIHRASFNIKKMRKDIKKISLGDKWEISKTDRGIRGVLKDQKTEDFKWRDDQRDFPEIALSKDFCMWRGQKYPLYKFDSSMPKGIPGWHNECASLVHHYCDKEFTHYGGVDLKQLHHPNESKIFQTLGEYNVTWEYTQPICVSLDGTQKMSKSKNTGVEITIENCKSWIPFLNSLSMKKVNTINPTFLKSEKILRIRGYMRSKRNILRYYMRRINAKSRKNYKAADIIRKKLLELGVKCRDTKRGNLLYQ